MIDIAVQMLCVFFVFCILERIVVVAGNKDVNPASRVFIVILGLIAGGILVSGAVGVHQIALGVTDHAAQLGPVPTL